MLRAIWEAIRNAWYSGKVIVRQLIQEVKTIAGVGKISPAVVAAPGSKLLALRVGAVVTAGAAILMSAVPGDAETRRVLSQSMYDMAKNFWTANPEEVQQADPKVPAPVIDDDGLHLTQSDGSTLSRNMFIRTTSYFGVY